MKNFLGIYEKLNFRIVGNLNFRENLIFILDNILCLQKK